MMDEKKEQDELKGLRSKSFSNYGRGTLGFVVRFCPRRTSPGTEFSVRAA